MFSYRAARFLIRSLLALGILLSIAGSTPSAQSLSGTISGTVVDE